LVAALSALSAEITLIGPASLLPTHADDWPVRLCLNLDEVLDQIDVLYLLRLQTERGAQGFIPSAAEYSARYGLTADRFAKLGTDVLVMHPGPVNRGVEIDGSILDCDRVLIGRQVAAGVVVRMGVLYRTLEPMAGTK
jgi:aspartate carbamoyltransferase catalytic subunit